MEKSEKNFLERFADVIPGLSGYRARESRRDTDKRLRDYLASRLDLVREKVGNAKLEFTNRGQLAALNDIGLLDRKIQTVTETIRFSSYGYSGFFDQVKIKEDQLDKLYAQDLKILGYVEELEAAVSNPDLPAKRALDIVKTMEEGLLERKNLWDTPSD